MGMTKLVAHMIPGLLLILVFAFLKSFVIPVEITVQGWFVFLIDPRGRLRSPL